MHSVSERSLRSRSYKEPEDRRRVERYRPKSGKAQVRPSFQNVDDPACPFDVNGYCVVHKDVHMANLKADGWKILLMDCPKCMSMQIKSINKKISDMEGKHRQGSDMSGEGTDKTENLTQDDSQELSPQPQHRSSSRRRAVRANDCKEQDVRKSGNSFYSVEEAKRRAPRTYNNEKQEVRKSKASSFHSSSRGGRTYGNDDQRATEERSRHRSSRASTHNQIAVRKQGSSFHSTRSRNEESSASCRRGSLHDPEHYNEESDNRLDEDEASYRSGRHGRGRGREDRARIKSCGPRRSCSRASRSSRGHRSETKYVTRPKPKTVCVNGVPFDKNGCCFLHPHVKLASKKLLGGWKVHHTFCKACQIEAQYDDDQSCSSRSGYSSSRKSSAHSDYSDYDDDSSRRSRGSRSMAGSVRSYASNMSASSWSSNQKRKSKQNDDSFLPLDADGFCTHHPDVQLAKLDKKGNWKVLMDFCPDCAEASLRIGGAPGTKLPSKSLRRSSQRDYDDNMSAKSSRSARSNVSERTFVEKMPFIDNDGKPGQYTGYLNIDGQPNGRGKMKYVDGKKFDGIWQDGNQIHGKVSYKRNGAGKSRKPADGERKKSEREVSRRNQ